MFLFLFCSLFLLQRSRDDLAGVRRHLFPSHVLGPGHGLQLRQQRRVARLLVRALPRQLRSQRPVHSAAAPLPHRQWRADHEHPALPVPGSRAAATHSLPTSRMHRHPRCASPTETVLPDHPLFPAMGSVSSRCSQSKHMANPVMT